MRQLKILIMLLICVVLITPPVEAEEDKHLDYAMRVFKRSPVVKP